MTRDTTEHGRGEGGKGRLSLVVSSKPDAAGAAPTAGERDGRGAAALARKALYRQTGLIEVTIDEERKRKAISDSLRSWGAKPAAGRSRRRALFAAAAILVALASVVPLYLASRRSLPGDPLWPLKRGGEGVRQWLARGAVAEAEASLAATAERLEEASRLASDQRFDAARQALERFYGEFDGARRRLRAVSREAHPQLYEEADRQLTGAAALDERLNGAAAHSTAPRGPEAVGTLSPTPRPPWEPENPRETPH